MKGSKDGSEDDVGSDDGSDDYGNDDDSDDDDGRDDARDDDDGRDEGENVGGDDDGAPGDQVVGRPILAIVLVADSEAKHRSTDDQLEQSVTSG